MQAKSKIKYVMNLSAKHKSFCDEYLANGFNATQAYKSVYGVSDKVAGSSAPRLLENARVKDYLQQEGQKTAQKLQITKEELLIDLVDIKNNNKGIRDVTAMKAIELISKMSGFDAPTRQEISIQEQPLLPDEDN
ncbi:MAG: terminase small subunit [Actinobacteria bacterium]|nr:terminase small subunit [Actinomycetota bacterium]